MTSTISDNSIFKILVVDDDPTVRATVSLQLKSENYTVYEAATANECLKTAREISPDLIALDVVLPDGDGFNLCRQLKADALLKNTYVVLLSAFKTSPDDQADGLDVGADGFITRPIEKREFLARIRAMLRLKKAETELRNQKEFFYVTLSSIGDAIIATDEKGFVTFMNQTACDLTGLSQEEVKGLTAFEAFPCKNFETGHPVEDIVKKVIQYRNSIAYPENAAILEKDGTYRFIEGKVSPIIDNAEQVTGAVLVLRDITEKKLLMQEHLRMQALEFMNALVSGIGYDFSNTLSAILENISLAQMHIRHDKELTEILTKAEQAALQADILTKHLQTMAKSNVPIKRKETLEDILSNAVQLSISGFDVTCDLVIIRPLWPIELDATQITYAIRNIIINAAEAYKESGHITVIAENITMTQELFPLTKGSFVRISIQDQGVGIAVEHLHKIFEPYFSTKPKRPGLGLTTAYYIIKQHDGLIITESESGKGTKCTIYLPALKNNSF